ncbi:ABC transporter substrate-binding protein [Lacticaseibacillus yichunensis]|uniref:ABC transporter substrate binding protein n=1 Tax=Lacticaseibacillus yichunensis TaxID=2486015 RepID=A0ABW4CS70_9LACO|nr:ABC transporter substrate-binding protein [Lacticaseibacillus yichunensis]
MKTKLLTLAVAAAAALSLSACSKTAQAKDDTVKVGILQLIDQTALTQARKGFEDGLAQAGYKGNKIKIDYLNAQGDQANLQTMSQRLKSDQNDLNLAIATPAAQALQKDDPDTPLLFTAVTDPVSANLTKSKADPSSNATGTIDMVDIPEQIGYMHRLFPKAKTVGMIYNAAEQNSVVQIKLAKAAVKKLGLKVTTTTVASTNDVQSATEALMNRCDVVYAPTDNTVAAAMKTVAKVSLKMKVPVVPAASTMVEDGGVASIGIDYYKLGVQTAKMAVKILQGKKVQDLPVESPAQTSVIKNKTMMKAFGLTEADVAND